MRAEIAKATYLPLPRWTAAASLALAVLAGVMLFVFRPSNTEVYTSVAEALLQFGVQIAALVMGVWIATLDYTFGTWQRTLTAESNRHRVLASKLTVALGYTALLCVTVGIVAGGFAVAASDAAGLSLDQTDLLRGLAGQIPGVVCAAGVGFGFGLLARSFGGGITLGLAFVFVLSSVFVLVEAISDWSFANLAGVVGDHIADQPVDGPELGPALAGLLGWVVIIVAPAWIRFLHSDVK